MNHWRIIQTIYCSLDFSHLLAQHYDGWMTSWRGLFSLDPEPQTSTTGVAGCSQALSWFWMNRLIWIWMNCRNSSKFLSECSILDGFLKDQDPKIAISEMMFFFDRSYLSYRIFVSGPNLFRYLRRANLVSFPKFCRRRYNEVVLRLWNNFPRGIRNSDQMVSQCRKLIMMAINPDSW